MVDAFADAVLFDELNAHVDGWWLVGSVELRLYWIRGNDDEPMYGSGTVYVCREEKQRQRMFQQNILNESAEE